MPARKKKAPARKRARRKPAPKSLTDQILERLNRWRVKLYTVTGFVAVSILAATQYQDLGGPVPATRTWVADQTTVLAADIRSIKANNLRTAIARNNRSLDELYALKKQTTRVVKRIRQLSRTIRRQEQALCKLDKTEPCPK